MMRRKMNWDESHESEFEECLRTVMKFGEEYWRIKVAAKEEEDKLIVFKVVLQTALLTKRKRRFVMEIERVKDEEVTPDFY